MNWTQQQEAAIQGRCKKLLVSAAAGSGKTAVLVERVFRRISDAKDPHDVTDFLIVTFTNAAAAEMRARILKRLGEALAAEPQAYDARLTFTQDSGGVWWMDSSSEYELMSILGL